MGKTPASHVMLKMTGASLHIQEVKQLQGFSGLSNRPGAGEGGQGAISLANSSAQYEGLISMSSCGSQYVTRCQQSSVLRCMCRPPGLKMHRASGLSVR